MPVLDLKPTQKVIKDYYHSLEEFDHFGVTHESAVRSAFQSLLERCGKQRGWKLIPEDSISLGGNKRIVVDGALIDKFKLPQGYWEAKDIHDDLPKENASQVRGMKIKQPQTVGKIVSESTFYCKYCHVVFIVQLGERYAAC